MDAFLVSLAVVFVAEIGDKSQLMALSFATRLPVVAVLAAVACSTALLMGLSVVVGSVAGDLIPEPVALAVSAVLFGAFGWWTFRRESPLQDHDEASVGGGFARLPFVAVFATFTLAELGDKTMLATVTLATSAPALATWAGATTGMLGANILAVGLGRAIGAALPERVVRLGSGGLFLALAAVLAVQAGLAAS